MKKAARVFLDTLFGRELDFRIRLFNVLAAAGAVISLAAAALGLFTGAALMNSLACLFSFLLALVFLYVSNRTGTYRIFYIITIVVVFIVLFPVMFFASGGYHGGMPVFFVFAVVFTVFMLDGKAAFCMALLELLIYTGLCLYAFRRPGQVHFFATEAKLLADVIIAFVAVSISLGLTLFLHIRIYTGQQRQLEKAREEAIRSSAVKSAFLAHVSHEIRTPINVILGMNEMVLRESAHLAGRGDPIAAYSQSIETAGKTLLELINNILDQSKIESGKTDILNEAYQTADLIQELSLAGAERARNKGLRFILDAGGNIPPQLYGDFIHLKQIGLNFLSNAAKYTGQGSITLGIHGHPAEKTGRETDNTSPRLFLLSLSVEDTGTGIKEEDKALLFTAFTRIDEPAHRNIEGTGLGLAIAKELADLMGGAITVKSEWGTGSVFTMEVPQILLPDNAAKKSRARTAPGKTPALTAPTGRVLAVDDNQENLLVIQSLLRRTRLTVDTASSGKECLEAVAQKTYHVIFMDYMMSGMDGIETFRQLRENPTSSMIPVIALTADTRNELKQRFLEEGFSGCLAKPLMWQDLEACLWEWLPADIIVKDPEDDGSEAAHRASPAAAEKGEHPLPPELKEDLAANLAARGVHLDEGLRRLEPEGNLVQYKHLAEFFTEKYETARREAQAMTEQKDWEGLGFSLHSLKSTALTVGAEDLGALAARMETHCRTRDGTYIETALPLFLLEWERVRGALEAFISRMNEVHPETTTPGEAPQAAGISGDKNREALLQHIQAHRLTGAQEILKSLAASGGPAPQRLQDIGEKLKALDFDGAEKLLRNE
jgi:signal transduction histidine kinase/HPt (histidine-containing phosphotransfer) domain-containing protein/ActR/RegA family two-component response regulator